MFTVSTAAFVCKYIERPEKGTMLDNLFDIQAV